MKKLFLTGISLLFAATITFAQEINPESKAKEVTTVLTEKLSLTEEQQQSIYKLILDKTKLKYSLKADTQLNVEEKAKQLEQVKVTFNAKVNEILTDEQKPIFDQYIQEQHKSKSKEIA